VVAWGRKNWCLPVASRGPAALRYSNRSSKAVRSWMCRHPLGYDSVRCIPPGTSTVCAEATSAGPPCAFVRFLRISAAHLNRENTENTVGGRDGFVHSSSPLVGCAFQPKYVKGFRQTDGAGPRGLSDRLRLDAVLSPAFQLFSTISISWSIGRDRAWSTDSLNHRDSCCDSNLRPRDTFRDCSCERIRGSRSTRS
jgi:hypothetical protein